MHHYNFISFEVHERAESRRRDAAVERAVRRARADERRVTYLLHALEHVFTHRRFHGLRSGA